MYTTAPHQAPYLLKYSDMKLFSRILGKKIYQIAVDAGINYMFFYRKKNIQEPIPLNIVAKIKHSLSEQRFEQTMRELQRELLEERIKKELYKDPPRRKAAIEAIPFERLTWKECQFVTGLYSIKQKTVGDLFYMQDPQISVKMNWQKLDRLTILQQEKLEEFMGDDWSTALVHLESYRRGMI